MQAPDAGMAAREDLDQRMALREIRRRARKRTGEPLDSADWAAVWELNDAPSARALRRVWRTLPSSPRCGMCSAPFAGPGRFVVQPLGYRPSRKNPTLCDTCVELSPPGGTTMYTGVLFADLRGFTGRSEVSDPTTMAALLRRFYGCAERVLFPEAIIDKVVGDQVMALYLPDIQRRISRDQVPAGHARPRPGPPALGRGTRLLTARSSRWGSGSMSATRTWATSASAPSTTSRPSATSSTPPPVCRARRRAARSSSRREFPTGCRDPSESPSNCRISGGRPTPSVATACRGVKRWNPPSSSQRLDRTELSRVR